MPYLLAIILWIRAIIVTLAQILYEILSFCARARAFAKEKDSQYLLSIENIKGKQVFQQSTMNDNGEIRYQTLYSAPQFLWIGKYGRA
jgi:hypothetical protein